MNNGLHFISGLPRSGSTLLAALLRQNPRIHAAMTSPVGSLVAGLLRLMSQEQETSVFIDDDQRQRVLKACVKAFYEDVHPDKVVFDTHRQWASKLPTLARLYPNAKVVCCVRNPAWVLDSVERLVRRNSLEPSGIFQFDPLGTVYSRADGLMSGAGMIGYALQSLRQAVFSDHGDRLMLVRYETLSTHPIETLKAITDFIGEPDFDYDPDNVEQDFDALVFDQRIGAPGLHAVRSKVRAAVRRSVLPPELFAKYQAEDFWNGGPDVFPADIKVV